MYAAKLMHPQCFSWSF